MVILAVYWIAVSANLASSGQLTPVVNASHVDGYSVPGVGTVVEMQMAYSQDVMNGFYYHFFGYLWTMQLFIALMHFAIASSVAQWYFCPACKWEKGAERSSQDCIQIVLWQALWNYGLRILGRCYRGGSTNDG